MKNLLPKIQLIGPAVALLITGLALPAPELAASSTRWSVSVGVGVPAGGREFYHGRDRYYAYRGSYYRFDRGRYYPCPPPEGYRLQRLPGHYERVYVGSDVYYRVNHIYYRDRGGYYEVIDAPEIVERPAPRPVKPSMAVPQKDELVAVWLDGERYLLEDGEYFRMARTGRVWAETPVGASIKVLPIGAITIWHENSEYFEFAGGYFRRSPSGFTVVTKPWQQPKADPTTTG